jgi:hypothetical protein
MKRIPYATSLSSTFSFGSNEKKRGRTQYPNPLQWGARRAQPIRTLSFSTTYKKLTGNAPSPLTPDEFDEVLKKPAGSADVDLFKKSRARARCRLARFVETRSADSIGPKARPVGKDTTGRV